MSDLGIIDQFLQTFIRYIDGGFGLLNGDIVGLTSILIGIDITLAALFWVLDGEANVLARLIKKVLYVGAFAYIGPNVTIGDNCKIYPNCYIADNVSIGNNVTFFSGVKIYFDCKLGNDIIIHSGAVIGGDGFGFAPTGDGSYQKISQIGNVVIEDNVEIGANTTVDRATMGSTIIRKGVKLDNLIQIAHNVEIDENTVVAAQTGISGSTKVGKNVIIGGQAGIVGHINIPNGTQLQAKTGLSRSIKEEGQKWAGSPASPYSEHMRSQVVLARLPELEKKVIELEKIIAGLKKDH